MTQLWATYDGAPREGSEGTGEAEEGGGTAGAKQSAAPLHPGAGCDKVAGGAAVGFSLPLE